MKHLGIWTTVASAILLGSTLSVWSLAPVQAATIPSGLSAANGLTTAEQAQAAQVARATEHINTTTGYVSVSTTALRDDGLTPSQVAYVETTIQQYDAHQNLTATSTPPVAQPSTYPPDTAIWDAYANWTGQFVILYEGAHPGWGWIHMQYRHNWKNTAVAQDCVQQTVADAQATGTDKYGHPIYDHWWKTTVPFETWTILLEVIVNNGNATGVVNSKGHGPGAVITGYPIYGNYVTKTWHGRPGTSIVPWWINDGLYQSTNKF